MNLEDLHDALNLLDDDMVEAVERMRSRRRKYSWIRILSAAACLCIGVMGIYAAGRLLFTAGSSLDGACEYVGSNDQELQLGIPEDGVETEAVNGAGITEALATVQLEIITLESDGFTGKVTEAENEAGFAPGEILTVILSEELDADIIGSLQAGDWVVVRYSIDQEAADGITAYEVTLSESGK